MIFDLDNSYGTRAHNGRVRSIYGEKNPERTPLELLGWAILEQAVDDLATLCRWGLITKKGKCLPWPMRMMKKNGYMVRVNVTIGGLRGPNCHRELCAFFMSEQAEQFCDLIGCNLPPAEIYWATLKHHGGLN